ncbi:MAG: hypothetical protein WKF72_04810 [Nocardioidaceae bacterium]
MTIGPGGAGARTPSDTPTVYLHIGTPKSGTSYLQGRLSANVPALAEQGFHWAHPWNRQVRAARNVRALRRGHQLQPGGPWRTLASEIVDWQGSTAIISMEWLVRSQPHQVEAAVASLAPARVEVVCIARDLARTVPAAWQEGTQTFRTWTWDDFLGAITGGRGATDPHHTEFWSQHDLVDIFRRWSTAVPLERTHLITVPPAGQPPELLWDRFCAVVGLDGSSFTSPPRDNASLGMASAQVMRRLNVTLREQGLSRTDYTRLGKHVLGKQVLPERRQLEGQITLPDDVQQWLSHRSEVMLGELGQLPINVVGDVAELAVPADATGRGLKRVSDAEMLDAAVAALAGLVAWTARREEQLIKEGAAVSTTPPARRPPATGSLSGPAMRALRRLPLGVVRRLTRRARHR